MHDRLLRASWLAVFSMAVVVAGCGDDTDDFDHDAGGTFDTGPGDTGTDPVDTGTDPVDTGTDPGDTGTDPGDTGADDTGTDPGDTGTEGVTWEDVYPIVQSSCAANISCHGGTLGGGGKRFAGPDINDAYAVTQTTPGNTGACGGATTVAACMAHRISEGTMPPSGTISAEDSATIAAWVTAGSPR